jgi:GWxTD domain-containing protein
MLVAVRFSMIFHRQVVFASFCLLISLFCLTVQEANGGLVRPLEGGGNFPAQFEVLNRWQDDGTLDVLILVEVSNADLTYKKEELGMVGRMRMEVELVPLEGETITLTKPFRTPSLVRSDSESRTLRQKIGLILRDVPVRQGRLNLHLYDVNQYRTGLVNQAKRNLRRSECATDWYAEDGPRPAAGIAISDPLFLFQAPLSQWDPSLQSHSQTNGGPLHDYMHPSRQYGLAQDKLQMFLPIWPPAGGIMPDRISKGLGIQITSLDMDFAVRDTIHFDSKGQLALEASRPAGLFYELDVNLLPQGSYRMTVVPLDGHGRGVSSGFDVIWMLDSLGRHRHLQLAEGHLVFHGKELAEFLEASPADREARLDDFWDGLNPDPENPVNEVYLEFKTRMAYVEQFFGGFSETGPKDDRGLVMILLGPPDEVQREGMPMNFKDQDDAQIKVFKRFAPDREGVFSKGNTQHGNGLTRPFNSSGGIPMPYSNLAATRIQSRTNTASHNFAFELWNYDQSGKPLYDNQFTASTMGTRFLFLDRTGSGHYELESSNAVQGED